jgi:hypothetical protein
MVVKDIIVAHAEDLVQRPEFPLTLAPPHPLWSTRATQVRFKIQWDHRSPLFENRANKKSSKHNQCLLS